MPREVPNDDFCNFMSEGYPYGSDPCTHFDSEEDTCDIDECPYPKWQLSFEAQEAED